VALSCGQSLGGDLAKTTPWWGLPSTLANRVCRLGERLFAASVRPQTVHETNVPPMYGMRGGEGCDGLTQQLLQPEVNRCRSSILQCVRYIVATDFFRLEKLPSASEKYK